MLSDNNIKVYIFKTINHKLSYRFNNEQYSNVYIDSSYLIHYDTKSYAETMAFDGKKIVDE